MKKIIVFLSLAFGLSGCCELLHLADLIIGGVEISGEYTETNKPFRIIAKINNFVQSNMKECEVESSNQGETSLKVMYRQDENSPWVEEVFTVDGAIQNAILKSTNPLEGNNSVMVEEDLLFPDPGDYRFIVGADESNTTPERSETNNIEERMETKSKNNYIIVRVTPADDYTPSERVLEGKTPSVIYLGGSVTYY